MSRRLLKPLPLLAAAVLAGLLSGCGGGGEPNLENGKALFVAKCGRCHQLKAAGTAGNPAIKGPNLDAAFRQARHDGMDSDTVEAVVHQQIENPRELPENSPFFMPPELVKGQDAKDVAAYVSKVAGVPGAKAQPVGQGSNEPGAKIFARLGCGSCHFLKQAGASGTTAPNLNETLVGKDRAYIERAIVNPSANIAPGFKDFMPKGYGAQLSPKELDQLVDFLMRSAGREQR
jgi:mono/diheme cytochrome c family protein